MKLTYHEVPSNFAVIFNLRRYTAVDTIDASTTAAALDILRAMTSGARDANRRTVYEAGVVPALVLFLRPGGVLQVDPIKPMVKAPGTKRLKL